MPRGLVALVVALSYGTTWADALGEREIVITPQDVLKAPLVLGLPKVEVDKEGPFLCGAVERGPGVLAFIPLKIEGASELTLTPHFEVRNPFGDRHDWVALDISFDGANYKPLAWLSGKRGVKQPKLVYKKSHKVECRGMKRLFLRLRISPWWYREFPRFRGLRVAAHPEGAKVEVDREWKKEDFFKVFRKAREPLRKKPAPHVLYHCGSPLFGLLAWDLIREESVDGYVMIEGWWDGFEDVLRTYEAMGVPFFYAQPHGLLKRRGTKEALDLAERILEIAPTSCQGFRIGEAWNADVVMKAPDFFYGLLELAKSKGKKVTWEEHGRDGSYGLGWWGWCLEHPEIFAKVVNRRYHDTLIVMHENNDPRSQMPNLGLVLGVWLQGLVDEWGASVQTWWWHDVGYGGLHECPPELIARMMLLYLSLGATWFEIEPMGMFMTADERGLPTRSKQWEGFETVYRLLSEGKMRIPKKGEVLSISPIGFVLREGKSGYSIFDPQPWLKKLPPVYAPRRLYSVERFGEELIPVTKYGFLPLFAPHAPVPRGFKAIETDGRRMVFGDEEIDLKRMEEVVAWETREMPFTSPNACVVAWREGEGYKLLLLHPEEKEPKEMKALVGQRIVKGILVLRDELTGEEFKAIGGVANIPLSGRRTFRLLSVRATHASR